MEWRNILQAYEEYHTNYYMNNQNIIDKDTDRIIAEEIANKEYKEMERGV